MPDCLKCIHFPVCSRRMGGMDLVPCEDYNYGKAGRIIGEWIDNSELYENGAIKTYSVSCSVCGRKSGSCWMRFCPWCGAEMVRKEKNDG